MSVQEIEAAVKELPASELDKFASWFEEFRAQAWDEQIERDIRAGRLDALAEQANREFEAGHCRPLPGS